MSRKLNIGRRLVGDCCERQQLMAFSISVIEYSFNAARRGFTAKDSSI